jgi:hypothetical protein
LKNKYSPLFVVAHLWQNLHTSMAIYKATGNVLNQRNWLVSKNLWSAYWRIARKAHVGNAISVQQSEMQILGAAGRA